MHLVTLPMASMPDKVRRPMRRFLNQWLLGRRYAYQRLAEGASTQTILDDLQAGLLPDAIVAATALQAAHRLSHPSGRYADHCRKQLSGPLPARLADEAAFLASVVPAADGRQPALHPLPAIKLYTEAGRLWADIRLSVPGAELSWAQSVPLDVPQPWRAQLIRYFTPAVHERRVLSRPCVAHLSWDGGKLAVDVWLPRMRQAVTAPAVTEVNAGSRFWEVSLPKAAAAAALIVGPALPAVAADYTVRQGDTLSSIARAHVGPSATWHSVFQANRDHLHNPHRIYPGMVLHLPGSTAAVPSGGLVVRPGDTLFRLAQRHLGNGAKWTVLWQANKGHLHSPHMIYAGTPLHLPGQAATAAAPAPHHAPAATAHKPATKPAPHAAHKPATKPAPQAAHKPATKPAPHAPTHTAHQPATKPAVRPIGVKPPQLPAKPPATASQPTTPLTPTMEPAAPLTPTTSMAPAYTPPMAPVNGAQAKPLEPASMTPAEPLVPAAARAGDPLEAAPPSSLTSQSGEPWRSTPIIQPASPAQPAAAKPAPAKPAAARPPAAKPAPVAAKPAIRPVPQAAKPPAKPAAKPAAPKPAAVAHAPAKPAAKPPVTPPAKPAAKPTAATPIQPAAPLADAPVSLQPGPPTEIEQPMTPPADPQAAAPLETLPPEPVAAVVTPAEPAATPAVTSAIPTGSGELRPPAMTRAFAAPFRTHVSLLYNPLSYKEDLASQDLSAAGSITQAIGAEAGWRLADPVELAGSYVYNSYRIDREGGEAAVRSENHGRLMGYYVLPLNQNLELGFGAGAQLSTYGTSATAPAAGREADLFDASYQRVMVQTEAKVGYQPVRDMPLTLSANLGVMPFGAVMQTQAMLPSTLWGVSYGVGARYSIMGVAIQAQYLGQQVMGTSYQQGNDVLRVGLGYEFR
jgi:LysM repeat protein